MKLLLSDWRVAEHLQQTLAVSELWPSLNWQGQQIQFKGPVQLSLQITGQQKSLLLRGEIAANLELACSRCAEDFLLPMRCVVDETISLADEDEQELFVDRAQDELDLSELGLQVLLENLPLQPLCRPDCRGLCSLCGQNLNRGNCDCETDPIDPRLAILGQLFRQDDQSKKEG